MKRPSLRALFFALICTFSFNVFAAGVDINTATASEIASAMKGVGDKKAQAIVAYREQNGPFKSIDQLSDVKGIGTATVDKNRDAVTVVEPAEKQKLTKK